MSLSTSKLTILTILIFRGRI